MTNYNDGKWHGWNGGECPVHPESIIDIRFEGGRQLGSQYNSPWAFDNAVAGSMEPDCWMHDRSDGCNPIVAFRVVKEYRQPRELWHLLDRDGQVFDTFTNVDDAKHDLTQYANFTLVHYREVMEDEA